MVGPEIQTSMMRIKNSIIIMMSLRGGCLWGIGFLFLLGACTVQKNICEYELSFYGGNRKFVGQYNYDCKKEHNNTYFFYDDVNGSFNMKFQVDHEKKTINSLTDEEFEEFGRIEKTKVVMFKDRKLEIECYNCNIPEGRNNLFIYVNSEFGVLLFKTSDHVRELRSINGNRLVVDSILHQIKRDSIFYHHGIKVWE